MLEPVIAALIATPVSILLYITTKKYGYFTNVIIYVVIRIVIDFFSLPHLTFKVIALMVILNILAGFLIVFMAKNLRNKYDHKLAFWYVALFLGFQCLVAREISKVLLLV